MGDLMRKTLSFCLIAASTSVAAVAQDTGTAPIPKKGEEVVVMGCLRGSALEAAEVSANDKLSGVGAGLTFRLTGDKSLLKDLKKKHDKQVVEVKGVLKSDLRPEGDEITRTKRMRIRIGGSPSAPGSMQEQASMSVPVVEVKSFDGTGSPCGR